MKRERNTEEERKKKINRKDMKKGNDSLWNRKQKETRKDGKNERRHKSTATRQGDRCARRTKRTQKQTGKGRETKGGGAKQHGN